MPPPDEPQRLSDVRYQDLVVGQRWGPFTERLEQEVSDALRDEVGASRPGDEAPFGVLPLLTLRVLRRALDGIVPGGVLTAQHFTAVDALPAAGDVDIDMWVSAQRQRPNGLSITFGFSLAAGGSVRALADWTILMPKALS
jgi:hypothetical protein